MTQRLDCAVFAKPGYVPYHTGTSVGHCYALVRYVPYRTVGVEVRPKLQSVSTWYVRIYTIPLYVLEPLVRVYRSQALLPGT
jgi:hypothetical protein